MKTEPDHSFPDRLGRGWLDILLSLPFVAVWFATMPVIGQVDATPPEIEIADVEVTKLGTELYHFDFYFLATDNEEVSGIEFRGAVNRGALDAWKSWPYLGSDYPFPIGLQCWAFDFEVRAVDLAGNRSAPAKWSFTAPIVKPVLRGPFEARGKVGEDFLYSIHASHATGYRAVGLPPGLSIDHKTGRIAGKPLKPGRYRVTLVASNKRASTRKAVVWRIRG